MEGEAYDSFVVYRHSKTASILFSQELARRYGLQGIISFSVHPSGTTTFVQMRAYTSL